MTSHREEAVFLHFLCSLYLTHLPVSPSQDVNLLYSGKKLEGLRHGVCGFETLKLILLFLATQTLIFSFMENFSFCRNKNNNYCSIMDSHKLIIPFIIKMKLKAHGSLHPSLWGPGCREVYLMTIPKSSPMVSRDTPAWLQQKFSRILVYNVGHVQKNRQFIKSLTQTQLPTSSKCWEWQSKQQSLTSSWTGLCASLRSETPSSLCSRTRRIRK